MIRNLKFFDWILIGLSLLAILVFAVIFFRRSSYIIAVVKVGEGSVFYPSWLTAWDDFSGTQKWFAESFYEGQTEKDGLGKIRAEVLSVYSYDKTPTRKTVYLTVKLKVVYNRASNTHTYKGVPVLVGSKIKLNLDSLYVEGLTISVEGFPENTVREKIVVEAQIREENSTFLETAGTKSYVADAIKVGDEIKDNNGKTVIKIIEKRVFPAQKVATTSDGRIILRSDPVKKDVYLKLEIQALKTGDRYFFLDDIPILVDQIIPINTSTISIFPVVTKFISTD